MRLTSIQLHIVFEFAILMYDKEKENTHMDIWKPSNRILAGTTLKDETKPCDGSMALHTNQPHKEIMSNRLAIANQLQIPLQQWCLLNQTHTNRIKKITKEDLGKGAYDNASAIHGYDALYTREKQILIGVFHADCLGILLYEPIQGIICAIHSGWKGTATGMVTNSIEHLIQKEHCDPTKMFAYVSMGIQKQSFEVGNDVLEQMKHVPLNISSYIQPLHPGKYLFDHSNFVIALLQNQNIPTSQIIWNSLDTFQETNFCFSYRRNKTLGRHLSFIYQKY